MAEKIIAGVIIEESHTLTLEEFCSATQTEQQTIIKMIEYQLIQPTGDSPEEWRFDSLSLKRGRMATSFYRDLEVNMAGIALAFELLDKIQELQHHVDLLQRLTKE